MVDPWVVRDGANSAGSELTVDSLVQGAHQTEFEDDFNTKIEESSQHSQPTKLPDSQQYLESLEKKLERLRRESNILQQLAARREECISNLLNDNLSIDRDVELALEAPILAGDSAVHEIFRHLRPVQPLNVGETVNIVKYDQLEEQRAQDEASEDSETASR